MFGKGVKGTLSFVFALCLIFITVTSAVAVGNIEEVKAFVNHSLKITFNGVLFEPKEVDGTAITPIIYNDRTYLPVRAISELTGLNVDWDAETSTVILEDKDDSNGNTPSVTEAPSPTPSGETPLPSSSQDGVSSSPTPSQPTPSLVSESPKPSTVPAGKYNVESPAPLNVTQKIKISNTDSNGKYYKADLRITFTDMKTGADALSFAESVGIDTSTLKESIELVAIKQVYDYSNVSTDNDGAYVSFWYDTYEIVRSGDNKMIGTQSYFEGGLSKAFSLAKFSNGSNESFSGWVIYTIIKGEVDSKVGFCGQDDRSDLTDDDYVWFKLTK